MAPVYSSLFDSHYYIDAGREVVVCFSPEGPAMDCYSFGSPSVNFEIHVIDDRLVVLDNNKSTGSDVILVYSQHQLDSSFSYDTSCDIYSNLRLNEISRMIAAGCSDGSIRVIGIETAVDSVAPSLEAGGVEILSSLTDDGFLASSGSNGLISVWRID